MRTRVKALIALVVVLSAFVIMPAMGVEGGDEDSPSLADRIAQLTEAVLGLQAEVEELSAQLDEATGEPGGDDKGDEVDDDADEPDAEDTAADGTANGETVDEASHGEVVSTVAECAPNGWVARDAGLPNHGFFVSAAARGETEFSFTVDGVESDTFDLTELEGDNGVAELCTALTEIVDPPAPVDADPEDGDTPTATAESSEEDTVRRGPGRSGDAPGRSGEGPPGQLKKNG